MIAAITAFFVGAVVLGVYSTVMLRRFDRVVAQRLTYIYGAQASGISASRGPTRLAPLTPRELHIPVVLEDTPQTVINAVLAAEDHRFYSHCGIDPHGIARAAWVNLRSLSFRQGGSTITQQLIKNRLLSSSRTVFRKLAEMWLAVLLERARSKDEILGAYLNEIYLGTHDGTVVRGIAAAARAYLGKDLSRLTLSEGALLGGMIQAPNRYQPIEHPSAARRRRDLVLRRMVKVGQITEAEYRRAERLPVRVRPASVATPAPYFIDLVRREVAQTFPAIRDGAGGAAMVVSTLDPLLQRLAERAVTRGLEALEEGHPRLKRREPSQKIQAALVALDPATAQIRALVGGRDYQASRFNRALHARRQVGSTLKPFVYAAALREENGTRRLTLATIIDDAPLTLYRNGTTWTPRNYRDDYAGPVSIRAALETSRNAATVRTAEAIGLAAITSTMQRAGIERRIDEVPALVLGALELTPLELAAAYVPFANGGIRPPRPSSIQRVEVEQVVLVPPRRAPEPVFSPGVAFLITSALQGVLSPPEAIHDAKRSRLAGKTGTTNDGRDAWFVGYSSNLVAAVWVGFDNNEPHGLTGASAALPIWRAFMSGALARHPSEGFSVPEGVYFTEVDANGRRASASCRAVRVEAFLIGTDPEDCEASRQPEVKPTWLSVFKKWW